MLQISVNMRRDQPKLTEYVGVAHMGIAED